MNIYKSLNKLLILLLSFIAWQPVVATRYFDASAFTILGQNRENVPGLSRIDMSAYGERENPVPQYAGFSTGVAVLFETDSPYIRVRWKNAYPTRGLNTTPLMQSGLDLYIEQNGEWLHAGVGLPTDSLVAERTLVEKMDGKMHRCLLYLPLWNKVENLEIGVSEYSDATVKAINPGFTKRVAFVGSSIIHGASASRAGLALPARIGRELSVECINLGFAGVCKLDDFYADLIIGTEADVFVIDAFSNPSAAQIRKRLRPFVEKIRKSRPDVPLVFIQTLIRETGNFNQSKRNEEKWKRVAAEEEMKKILDEYNDVYFLNPGMSLGDKDRTVDGVHPTDAGFESIIRNIKSSIQDLLK